MNEPDDLRCLVARHEARLAVLESELPQHVQALKERMDLKFEAADKAIKIKSDADSQALALQYEITQKHLLDLNHQHAETRANQAVSVTRDKFDDFQRGIVAGLDDLRKFRDTMIGKMAVIGGATGILGAVLAKWLLP